jgi:hypothetical protein
MSSSSGMARTWASISLVGAEILVQIIGFDWLTSHLWGFASTSGRLNVVGQRDKNPQLWQYRIGDTVVVYCLLMIGVGDRSNPKRKASYRSN